MLRAMKVKSITDVITNSSSETFIKVYNDDIEKLELLKTEIEKITSFCDVVGDGGIWIDKEEKYLDISVGYGAAESGLNEFAKIGFEYWMQQFKDQGYKIDLNPEEY